MRSYFRDVQDHALRVRDQVAGLDELLSNSILQAALAQVSVAQNDDMRRISSWAGLIAAPTLVAGVYGMNFEHMPELDWQFGYPLRPAAHGRPGLPALPRLQAQRLAVSPCRRRCCARMAVPGR